MISSDTFAAKVEEIGRNARFSHRGRMPNRCDCVGLVFVTAAALGIEVEPFIDYQRQPDSAVVLAMVAKRCDARDWSEWGVRGRILIVKPDVAADPIHVAVSTGNGLALQMGRRMRGVQIDRELVHSVWTLRGVSP